MEREEEDPEMLTEGADGYNSGRMGRKPLHPPEPKTWREANRADGYLLLTSLPPERLRAVEAMAPLLEQVRQGACNNRSAVLRAERCGCFSCKRFFAPQQDKVRSKVIASVIKWTKGGHNILCPYCHVDAVLVDSPERPVSAELLLDLHDYFFERENVPVSSARA